MTKGERVVGLQRPTISVFEGYSPEQQTKIQGFLGSPLSRLVIDIEMAKIGVRRIDYGQGRRNISKALGQKDSAFRAIKRNPEFRSLWDPEVYDDYQKSFQSSSMDLYAELLSGDNSTELKLLAASEPFKNYIREFQGNVPPGPYFLRVLAALPDIDQVGMSLITNHYQQLAELDEQYFWFAHQLKFSQDGNWASGSEEDIIGYLTHLLGSIPHQIKGDVARVMTYKEACEQALNRFSDISDRIITTAFNTADQSDWRQFVVDNFDVFAALTSLSLAGNVERGYDPYPQYNRLKSLFDQCSESYREFLAPYMIFSTTYGESSINQEMDEEIIRGDAQRAVDFTTFWLGVKSARPYFYNNTEVEAYEYWSKAYLKGDIDSQKLKLVQPSLRCLRPGPFDGTPAHNRALAELSKSEAVLVQEGILSSLVEENIFPTAALVDLAVKVGPQRVKTELYRLKEETDNGNFDFENPVQRDLEYAKYLDLESIRQNKEKATYDEFSQIPFDPDFERVPILDQKDRMEARAAALEAARVYWIVKERVDAGRNVLVVGNERYGKLFVVDPLKDELDALGVNIMSSYIRSGRGDKDYEKTFDDETLEHIAQELPDIIVVDGTGTPWKAENRARYSRAMHGFYNWMRVFNAGAEDFDPEDSSIYNPTIPRDEKYWDLRTKIASLKPASSYKIQFRSAYSPDTIIIGDMPVDVVKPDDSAPQFIIVNSTIEPKQIKDFPNDLKDHKPAYFDDPETKANSGQNKKVLVFTKKGLEEVSGQRSVGRYVSAVQTAIRQAIPEMIMSKASDPNF